MLLLPDCPLLWLLLLLRPLTEASDGAGRGARAGPAPGRRTMVFT
jgi:hypothetical protein